MRTRMDLSLAAFALVAGANVVLGFLGAVGARSVGDGLAVGFEGLLTLAFEVVGLAEAQPGGDACVEVEVIRLGGDAEEVAKGVVEVVVPELDGGAVIKDLLLGEVFVAAEVPLAEFVDGIDGGERLGLVTEVGVHLREFEPEEVVTGKPGEQVFEQGDGVGGPALAAVDGGQEDGGLGTVAVTLTVDEFDGLYALFAVAAKADQEAEDLIGPGETADDVVVNALGEAGVDEAGVGIGEGVVEFAGGGGVAERVDPGAADDEIVVGAETVGHAEGVGGVAVPGLGGESFAGERHGLVDGVVEVGLVGGAGVHFGAAEEGIAAGDEFGLEGAGAEHFAVEDGFGEVVEEVWGIGVLPGEAAEDPDSLIEFEVIEVIEAAPDVLIEGRRQEGDLCYDREHKESPKYWKIEEFRR